MIVLTLTMIVGVITIVSLIVTRMPRPMQTPPVQIALPDEIVLPEGSRPIAITRGAGWFAVVTSDDRILIFNPDGSLRQEVAVTPAK